MLRTRYSGTDKDNPRLKPLPARDGETNSAWIARAGVKDGVLLIGGCSLVDFRLRVAQAHLRRDLMPSFWSHAGILRGGREIATVPLTWPNASEIPSRNAVQTLELAAIDDPRWFPNVAVIRFARDIGPVADGLTRVCYERSIVDLPKLLLAWLGFAWGAGEQGNPLLAGFGVPSAALVEAAHALAGVELTPGLSSDASCPEAIWLSAKWWHDYYAETKRKEEPTRMVPEGRFVTRQRAAFVWDPGDAGPGAHDAYGPPAAKGQTPRARKRARRRRP